MKLHKRCPCCGTGSAMYSTDKQPCCNSCLDVISRGGYRTFAKKHKVQ